VREKIKLFFTRRFGKGAFFFYILFNGLF